MKVLVINAGSSSLKYQLINMETEKVLAKGICERIGDKGSCISGNNFKIKKKFKIPVNMPNHTVAFLEVKKALTQGDYAVISDLSEITAIGHRIVQGGALFNKSMLVTEEVIEGIESLCDLAPLHNPAHLQGIRACQEVFGMDVPEVVVFDNAFHSTMPPKAYMFALPYEYYEKYQIRRYGFHGTSHRYVSARCAELMKKDLKGIKMITCHLGNGSSITAIEDGKVIDTSMGLTPLDGFMMGTRCGGVDPSAILYLMEKEGWTPKQTSEVLNKKSGMLGISRLSSDDRDLAEFAEDGVKCAACTLDEKCPICTEKKREEIADKAKRAKFTRDMLWYQIRKFIGSYVAALNGVDAIVFTGGIGENGEHIREDICRNLSYLGIEIDKEINKKALHGVEAEISTPNSKVKVYVIPTEEELMIARDTKAIVESL